MQEAYHLPHSHSKSLLFRGGGVPRQKFFSPVWTCIKPNLVSKIFPFTRDGGVPWQKFFFPVWTCIKPNLVSKIFPFTETGYLPLTKTFFPTWTWDPPPPGVWDPPIAWDLGTSPLPWSGPGTPPPTSTWTWDPPTWTWDPPLDLRLGTPPPSRCGLTHKVKI